MPYTLLVTTVLGLCCQRPRLTFEICGDLRYVDVPFLVCTALVFIAMMACNVAVAMCKINLVCVVTKFQVR